MKFSEALWKKNVRRSLWQHPIWEGFQKKSGRKTHWIKTRKAQALLVKREMPLGLSWLEIPRGPLFEDQKSLNELLKEIKKFGKKEKAVFVRMSPFNFYFPANLPSIRNTEFDHHPQTSLIIELNQTEEEILKQMKQKGRYNIKVAQKHGIKVKVSDQADVFYELLTTTGARDRFGIHEVGYYKNMLEAMPDHAQLLLAFHGDRVIAGGIFVYLDNYGIYYYGASDNNYRNMMAPYLLQWEAIKEAKKRGCNRYDFLGIAPEGAKNHPWKGVTEFKKKFGGRVVNYPIAKDMVLRPFWYLIYRLYKKLR